MAKLIFNNKLFAVFSVTWSIRKIMRNIINAEIYIFISGFFGEYKKKKKWKEQHLFDLEIFRNISYKCIYCHSRYLIFISNLI